MITSRQIALLIMFIALAAALLLLSRRPAEQRRASVNPTPPVWDATTSTPEPDPSIDEELHKAPKLKNHL